MTFFCHPSHTYPFPTYFTHKKFRSASWRKAYNSLKLIVLSSIDKLLYFKIFLIHLSWDCLFLNQHSGLNCAWSLYRLFFEKKCICETNLISVEMAISVIIAREIDSINLYYRLPNFAVGKLTALINDISYKRNAVLICAYKCYRTLQRMFHR